METVAKLFMNGRSQAVRISKAFRFEGVDSVIVRKDGDTLLIRPARRSCDPFPPRFRGPRPSPARAWGGNPPKMSDRRRNRPKNLRSRGKEISGTPDSLAVADSPNSASPSNRNRLIAGSGTRLALPCARPRSPPDSHKAILSLLVRDSAPRLRCGHRRPGTFRLGRSDLCAPYRRGRRRLVTDGVTKFRWIVRTWSLPE